MSVSPAKTLFDLVQKNSDYYPNNLGLLFVGTHVFKGRNEEISFSKICSNAKKIARVFSDRGLKKGDVLAIFLPNCPEFIYGYFASWYLGIVVVPANTMLSKRELSLILGETEAKALLIDSTSAKMVSEILPDLKDLKHVFVVQSSDGTEVQGIDKQRFILDFTELFSSTSELDSRPLVTPGDLATILYTSGTTGKMKGAMLTMRNYFIDWEASAERFYLSSRETLVMTPPIFHAFGLTNFGAATYAGCPMIMPERYNPELVLSLIQERKATVLAAVPTMIIGMLNFPDSRDYDTSTLKHVISGGAPMADEINNRFKNMFGCDIQLGYGMTESAGSIAFTLTRDRSWFNLRGFIPLRTVNVRVVGEDGKDLPAGEIGEVLVSGPKVSSGYYRKPEETALAFSNGWLKTGDLGTIDEDGRIYVIDRKKDMINFGGLKIYAREVEDVLYTNSKIFEVAIIGVPDSYYGEIAKACIVLKSGQSSSPEEIQDFLKDKVAKYKIPRIIEFVASLPKTASGKLDKKVLRGTQ